MKLIISTALQIINKDDLKQFIDKVANEQTKQEIEDSVRLIVDEKIVDNVKIEFGDFDKSTKTIQVKITKL